MSGRAPGHRKRVVLHSRRAPTTAPYLPWSFQQGVAAMKATFRDIRPESCPRLQQPRYLGWVKKNIVNGKQATGLILSHEADEKLGYAVSAHPALSLRYFKLKLILINEDEMK